MSLRRSHGSAANGAPNLMYGPGSKAWSITVTPTYQYKIFFARAEFSHVGTSGTTAGLVFGPNGTNTTQTRAVFEVGILFRARGFGAISLMIGPSMEKSGQRSWLFA